MDRFSVNSISENLGFRLAKTLGKQQDAEMIAYGLEIFLGSIVKLSFLFIIAALLGVLQEAALLLLVTGSLRTFSGGAHCTAHYRCMLTSTIVILSLGIFIKKAFPVLTGYTLIHLTLLLSISLCLYWHYSPQASLNKPLLSTVAKHRFRYVTIAIFLVYSFVCFTLGTGSRISWQIALGMFWQAVTLTGYGHGIVSLFDRFFTLNKGGAVR